MWQNIKYYLLAYAVMATGSLVSTALQLLAAEFPTGHPVSTLAANLSGVTMGGLIMVIGFLKDQRLEEERKRVDQQHELTKQALQLVHEERERADAERERADAERERADRSEAELNRVRAEYEAAAKALIQRLEELNRNGSSGSDPAE